MSYHDEFQRASIFQRSFLIQYISKIYPAEDPKPNFHQITENNGQLVSPCDKIT